MEGDDNPPPILGFIRMANKRKYSGRRDKYLKIITLSLPFLAVIILELSLRLFHYGHDLSVFVNYPQNPDYLVFNAHAAKRFFRDARFAPSGNKELLKKKKDANTLRFIVLGESTTIGYPYFHNGSFHRWLLYRLLHTYPDKHFEIINLSLTGVNSYAIRQFASEIVHYEPDAVLIYVGQNEYYGGLGVASTQHFGSNPHIVNAILQLRSFRTVQWLTSQTVRTTEADATRMELMAGNQHVARNSELFTKGLRQFEYNMDAAAGILEKHAIPVFISNAVSNIKDLPPFVSDETDNNAMQLFDLGRSACERGDYTLAYDYFYQAKETDLLRFRAPEELNQTIEEICARYPHAYFVNTKQAMESRSPHGMLGDELFTDHVHPNLRGYAIMSEAFYAAMQGSGLLPHPQENTTDEWLESDMPVSPIDSLAGEFRIMQLKAHFPFNDSRYANRPTPENTTEERLAAQLFRKEADWMSAHDALYKDYTGKRRLTDAANIVENTMLEFAEDPAFYEQAAMIYGEAGQREKAAFYLHKSFDMQPESKKAYYLTVFYLMLDNPEAAMPYLDYAIAHNEGNIPLAQIKPLVEQAAGLKKQLAAQPDNAELLLQIADTYRRMDNKEVADKYEALRLQHNVTVKQTVTK